MKLKKRKMSFEIDTLGVIALLYSNEGDRYNEPMDEDVRSSIIENIYKITRHKEYHIDPTTDGDLIW